MVFDARIKIDDREVTAAVRRVLGFIPVGGDGRPVFNIIGRVAKSDTQLRFRSQKSPDGTAWLPSQRVLEEGGQTLSLTRRLRNSITFLADHASAEIGTNVIYGRIQHLGGVAGRRGAAHRPRIPARRFLGLSAEGGKEAVAALNEFLGRQWQR